MIRLRQPQAVSNFQETRLKALLKRPLTMIQIPSGILSGLVTLRHTPLLWPWKKLKKSMAWRISHAQVVEMVLWRATKSTHKKMAKWSRFQKEAGTTTPKKKQSTLRRCILTRLSWKYWKALVVLQVQLKFIYWNLSKKSKKRLHQVNQKNQLHQKNQK